MTSKKQHGGNQIFDIALSITIFAIVGSGFFICRFCSSSREELFPPTYRVSVITYLLPQVISIIM